MPHFTEAGMKMDLCPYLLAAVCARESGGGVYLVPRGPHGLGDRGHGHGLLQVDGRYHAKFLHMRLPSGALAWQDPRENILYGASLLRQNLRLLGGDLQAAIAAYNASWQRVRAVQRRLAPAVALELRLRAYDDVTTGRDYVSDVLRRWAGFRATHCPPLEVERPEQRPVAVHVFQPLTRRSTP